MPELYEVVIDGKPHSGAYSTRAEAERGLDALRREHAGKDVQVRQRSDDPSKGRYVDSPDADPNYVANALKSQGIDGSSVGPGTQGLAQGIIPGPGGVANTGEAPVPPQPQVEGKHPDDAKKLEGEKTRERKGER